MLNLCFMGKSKIEYNCKGLEYQLGAKAIALICILVLNNRRYLSREKIEGFLWPESDTQAARYNLRYNIWLIKKNIGADSNGNMFLNVDNECCYINTDYEFKCDIIDIVKFKPSQEDSIVSILELKQLFQGDLLEGHYFKNCDELNDLIIFERMKFEQHKVRVLKRLVELYEINNNYDSCLQTINEIHEIEPYDEEIALKTLNLYVKHEKPVAAIRYYNNFSEVLSNSLGVSPSYKLRNKYQEIKSTLSGNHDDNNMEKEETRDTRYHHNQNSSDLKIISDCIEGIEYFWIADVVGKVISSIDSDCINKLDETELLDLGHIQKDLLKYSNVKDDLLQEYEREILSVNIINAFIKLLKCTCENYSLKIIVLNSSYMDDTSINVFNYLKRTNIEGLTFVGE